MDIKTGNAKDKLDTAMNGLVESVYSKLNMVNRFVESDADLLSILNGTDDEQIAFTGQGANNEDALNEISQWLELQIRRCSVPQWAMYNAGIRRFPTAGAKLILLR